MTATEREAAEIEIKYAGFIEREEVAQRRLLARHGAPLPANLDYSAITTISLEAREKLGKVLPQA